MGDSLLVPQTSSVTGWTPFLVDEDRSSFSYHLPYVATTSSWTSVDELDGWFDALHPSRFEKDDNHSFLAWTDAYYKGEKLLRQTAWCTLQTGCRCDYGYSDTWQQRVTNTQLLSVVETITAKIKQLTGCPSLNSCNLNYYPQGGGVGFHADDEFLFDGTRRPTCIVSLSLCRNSGGSGGGGTRKLIVKNQECAEEQAQDDYPEGCLQELILGHGDVMTMEGMFQKHYFHSIWPGDSKKFMDDPLTQGERINLTWRTIVQHLDGSESCRGKICPLARLETE
jgi:alkylated DNA repair dioxygenase AlkB